MPTSGGPVFGLARRNAALVAPLATCSLLLGPFAIASATAAPSPDVVNSEVYGGGGNSGATFTHDFIELYNRGADPVDLSGWSVQYASRDQGTEHRSPFEGEAVSNVPGVVSQHTGNGFWMQDPTPDDDIATSEGIFVFTRSAPAAALTRGTAVTVSGTVSEFRPGGDSNANLSITQIAASSVETGPEDRVPAATVVGPDRRTPPNRIIEDDSSGDVELDNTFDPAVDGIDFWESMEGMRVRVQAPEVVGPTSRFDELPAVTAGATVRTVRDGIRVARRRGPLGAGNRRADRRQPRAHHLGCSVRHVDACRRRRRHTRRRRRWGSGLLVRQLQALR